jgi:hypothetical protein
MWGGDGGGSILNTKIPNTKYRNTKYKHTKYQIPNTKYQIPNTKIPNTKIPNTKYQNTTSRQQRVWVRSNHWMHALLLAKTAINFNEKLGEARPKSELDSRHQTNWRSSTQVWARLSTSDWLTNSNCQCNLIGLATISCMPKSLPMVRFNEAWGNVNGSLRATAIVKAK